MSSCNWTIKHQWDADLVFHKQHILSQGLFGYNLFLLKLKNVNWRYCNKIIFKYVNSAVEFVNSAICSMHSAHMWYYCSWTVSLSLHSTHMWYYCSRVREKKKFLMTQPPRLMTGWWRSHLGWWFTHNFLFWPGIKNEKKKNPIYSLTNLFKTD